MVCRPCSTSDLAENSPLLVATPAISFPPPSSLSLSLQKGLATPNILLTTSVMSALPSRTTTLHDEPTTFAKPRAETVSLTDQTNLLPRKQVMAVFFGLALCILVSCLDSTIVATALPTISAAFNAGSIVSWVPSAYFLTSTAFQPLCEYILPGRGAAVMRCPAVQPISTWTRTTTARRHVLWSDSDC